MDGCKASAEPLHPSRHRRAPRIGRRRSQQPQFRGILAAAALPTTRPATTAIAPIGAIDIAIDISIAKDIAIDIQ